MSEAGRGGVFVSYRRQETSGSAGRLADQLASHFGTDRVFIDVDTIEPGVDFAEAIALAVETCDVLLAVIGPQWLTATDQRRHRRLDDPDDIVRIEIEAALAGEVRIIPVLVENAVMPRRQDLPESLATLARRNAFTVRHESFRYDVERLIASIEGVLATGSRTQREAVRDIEADLLRAFAQSEKTGKPTPLLGRPAIRQERWQMELLSNDGFRKTFRLWAGSEVHLISLDFRTFRKEVIKVDGRPANSKWSNSNKDVPITLGSTPGFVHVSVGDIDIFSVVFTIGDQSLSYHR